MKEKFIYRVVIDICINYPGHSRGKIDGINIFKKSYLRQKMGMIVTEETKNESIRNNAASMIGEKNKELKFISFAEIFIKLCSSENIQMSVNGVLNHNKRQHISKMTSRHYHLQK